MHRLKTFTSTIIALTAMQVAAAPTAPSGEQAVLKRLTISTIVAGKEVSSIQLPLGVPARLEWNAQKTDYRPDGSTVLSGRAQLSLALGTLPTVSLSGDEISVRSTELTPAEAQAVRDIEKMGVSDQSIRGNPADVSESDMARQEVIDRANMKRLSEIIDRFGWPGNSFAGVDNANHAFLVLQHADLDSQRKYLPILREAVTQAQASPSNLAMLEDRVLVGEGRPQRYGTQFKSSKPLVMHPVADEANLDRRRSEVGLPPMADYIEILREMYKTP